MALTAPNEFARTDGRGVDVVMDLTLYPTEPAVQGIELDRALRTLPGETGDPAGSITVEP